MKAREEASKHDVRPAKLDAAAIAQILKERPELVGLTDRELELYLESQLRSSWEDELEEALLTKSVRKPRVPSRRAPRTNNTQVAQHSVIVRHKDMLAKARAERKARVLAAANTSVHRQRQRPPRRPRPGPRKPRQRKVAATGTR